MTGLTLIQARLGSRRFPQKVLAELGGRPVIQWVVERAKAIGLPVILACPMADAPALVANLNHPVPIWASDRPEADVLGRLMDAVRSQAFGTPDLILRVTADSPLIDPALGRKLVRAWEIAASFGGVRLDYLAPCYPPPECADGGLDIEALATEALGRADREATDPEDREHPSRFIWRQPDQFVCRRHDDPHGYGARGIRWMIDEPADLMRLNRLVERLTPGETGWRATRAAELAAQADTRA